jgi:hypothetical protein
MKNQFMNKSNQHGRISVIIQTMKEAEQSELSISQYFKQNVTPFGRTLFYIIYTREQLNNVE